MNHVIAVPLDQNLAEFIGKKGSVNGITFFDRKSGDDVIVALMPSSVEEKPYGMAEALLLGEEVVLSTALVDKSFGETLVACSLLGKHVLLTNDNDVSNLLSGGVLKDYEIVGRDVLLDRILSFKTRQDSSPVRIDIDKAFPVHGVGTVALGFVTSGVVKTHDQLCHPSGKRPVVRSIQSQDVDVKEAGVGTRVGLALKGIEHDEMEKGDILCAAPVPKARGAKVKLTVSGIAGERLQESVQYQFVSNFAHANARLKEDGEAHLVSFEKPISVCNGDGFFLIRSQKPRIFAFGTVSATMPNL